MDANLIGKKLKALRGSNTQCAVAEKLGISVSALAMYENGCRIPRDEIKLKIANLYEKSVEEIFFTL